MFPSPNFTGRRGGLGPRLIVLHYTAMADAAAARARLCDPAAEVSAHWLIGADGTAEQLVAEDMRAWHAGAGAWRGCADVNSASIGIELDNPGDRPFAEAQMRALETLLAAVMARWGIGPEGVIGHSDMAPGRKTDPGPRFDWRRLAVQGLALWPRPGAAAMTDPPPLAGSLDAIGYPQVAPDLRLAAFRARFHPGAQGPETAQDRALAADLAAQMARAAPIDPRPADA
ncbi:N-acetylmuramoyl-L-alanine amidase [Phaeovulum vinaykumarii]|uniref:N-acetylmuramoyl-L-alanine amidase n=1 Tax=Phaeovulum vinaykumarii TaxID=407234 RepID=A0A1N7L3E7_9RHOB|nr:N-acetylmuramoyl-L-alanine amidase [Phaeovulum vinaykumarii]SIS68321.1 N-acetylmuramoyl-L-alanine amidase [Phaeovulum vinaykumarii]SOC00159.1 N-acetylmuramoyl-L-alanine amidase [Phaeovulum vinaykumarii]